MPANDLAGAKRPTGSPVPCVSPGGSGRQATQPQILADFNAEHQA